MFDNLSKVDGGRLALIASLGSALAGGALLAHHLYKRHRYWNSEFVQAGTIESLYIYPIKSCKALEVNWIDCTERGGAHGENRDRFFVVVDAKQDNLFLTARVLPQMVLIESYVENGQLTVSVPTGNNKKTSVCVDLSMVVNNNDIRRAILHSKSKTDGYDCGDEVSAFITRFLKQEGRRDLRLLYFTEEGLYTERDYATKSNYWNNPVPQITDKIGYADLASYMAFSSASVDDLNERLKEQQVDGVDERYFRPVFVVSGVPAYDEDRWLNVRIGDAEFVCYKPCTRCILTTVDPDSGVKRDNMQPIKELRKYRLAPEGKLLSQYKESPIFGVNLALIKAGRIRRGDQVFIRYKPSIY